MEISVFLILYIMFLHWFADFVLQTNWMATNKSSNNLALMSHVLVYTAVMFCGTLVLSNSLFILWAIVNGVLHFCVDYVTSRITKKLWTENKVHDFFVMIGLDQLIHAMTLILTLSWIST